MEIMIDWLIDNINDMDEVGDENHDIQGPRGRIQAGTINSSNCLIFYSSYSSFYLILKWMKLDVIESWNSSQSLGFSFPS